MIFTRIFTLQVPHSFASVASLCRLPIAAAPTLLAPRGCGMAAANTAAGAAPVQHFYSQTSKAIVVRLYRNGDKVRRTTHLKMPSSAAEPHREASSRDGPPQRALCLLCPTRLLSLSLSLVNQHHTGVELTLNPKLIKTLDQVYDKATDKVKLVTGGEQHATRDRDSQQVESECVPLEFT